MSPLPPLLGLLFGALLLAATLTSAQSSSSCSLPPLTPTHSIRTSVASGYSAALIATGLTKPRSLQFDSSGNLLVVQAGNGIESLQLSDAGGGCVGVKGRKTVVQGTGLNHGLALSADGKTLYASSSEAVYSWDYDPASSTVGGANRTIVNGMNTQDHTTRTLLLSRKAPGMLIVSRGSTSNIDPLAEELSSGHSQIRAFDLMNMTATSEPYSFDTEGLRLGWGLRNSVGVAENQNSGGLYSVENSADDVTRDGVDIHQDNPGEEMNFHGSLIDNKYAGQGGYYGYPKCFAAWMPSELPQNGNLTVGSQFAIGTPNATVNDSYCAEQIAPRLTFQAHMAPLDLKFNSSESEAWVTFHGSWDRTSPSGYKLSKLAFTPTGEPSAPANSNTSLQDIFTNVDNSKCANNCFRPVGIAFDSQGRLFMSSDASGEIYLIVSDTAANGTSGGGGGASPAPGNAGGGGKTGGVMGRWGGSSWLVVGLAVLGFWFGL